MADGKSQNWNSSSCKKRSSTRRVSKGPAEAPSGLSWARMMCHPTVTSGDGVAVRGGKSLLFTHYIAVNCLNFFFFLQWTCVPFIIKKQERSTHWPSFTDEMWVCGWELSSGLMASGHLILFLHWTKRQGRRMGHSWSVSGGGWGESGWLRAVRKQQGWGCPHIPSHRAVPYLLRSSLSHCCLSSRPGIF